MKGKRLIQAIGIVAIINLLSRFMGIFREIVVGYQFGTNYAADSVALAYTLPNFFYVVVGGAITTAFISVYTKIEGPLGQREYLERVFAWMAVGLILFSAGLVIFSEQIIGLLFPGLSEENFRLTADLFRIMAPATFFLMISMWLTGILNVNDRFSWAATATLLLNGSFLGIAVVFFPWLGAFAHAWGAVISALLMCVFLVVLIRRGKFFHFGFSFKRSPETWRTMKLAVPILLGGATLQLYFLIHRMFASFLGEGYIAALNYMSKIVQLPQSVLMMAVTTVVYPLLSRKVAAGEKSGISSLYMKGLRLMGISILPVAVFVVFYAEDIVRAIFQYGSFSEQSTEMSAPLLKILVIGMFFHAANLYVTRFFYAYEHSIYPVVVSLVSVLGINVGINFLLIEPFGAAGLAWGTSIASICNFGLLLIGTQYVLKLEKTSDVKWGADVLKLVTLLITFAALLYGWQTMFEVGGAYISLAAGACIAGILLLLLMKVLRFREIDDMVDYVKKKVVRSR
ncbi:murein biosynthesis integral membrane protein MurJ [Salibacterium salarium]|uniref:Probable lipid II flippase MurJ n=1 Tax=Salibacterium salarium TaxID=284579 RepID=A0A428N581_9BACI|nr:murein biosynthesis integral membrane protein MurJ [Salibacterium salarium]RSL33653.1 murein biosynthesis integral membrane protein MurJ [Salibacterium salarium]